MQSFITGRSREIELRFDYTRVFCGIYVMKLNVVKITFFDVFRMEIILRTRKVRVRNLIVPQNTI